MKRKRSQNGRENASAETRSRDARRRARRPDGSPSRADTLQQGVGNQAVQQLYQQGSIQAKLEVNSPDDPAEREAERVAERVVRMENVENETTASDAPTIQRSAAKHTGDSTLTGDAETEVRSALGGGTPLPESTRSYFEPRFGQDFSDVRIHTGSKADEAAQSINASAFTLGTDIAFADGSYDPNSNRGKALLAHELTHIVQQRDSADTLINRQMTIVIPDADAPRILGEWLLDFGSRIPGNVIGVLQNMGLGALRTGETYGYMFTLDGQALAQVGHENAQAIGAIWRVISDSSVREELIETVTEHYLAEIYACLPEAVRQELESRARREVGTEVGSYVAASVVVGVMMQSAMGESIIKILKRLVVERKLTNEILAMFVSWSLTFGVGGLLKFQGILEKSATARDQLEALRPELYADLAAKDLTGAYFLIGELESELRDVIINEIEGETGMEVPDECFPRENDPFSSVTPEEMTNALALMYGVPMVFDDMDYSMWFPDSWDLSDWEDGSARRDVSIMADAIYYNMEAYQDDYYLGLAEGEAYGAVQIGLHPDELPLEVLLTYDGHSGGSDFYDLFFDFKNALQTREIEIYGEAGHTFVTTDDPFTYTYPDFVAAAERAGLITWR